MKDYRKLKDMLCEELDKFAERKELNGSSLDMIHKLTDTIKNLDKIEMLEEEGGYSERGRRGGYSRDGGDWEARGSYAGNSYEGGGNSSRGGGNYGGSSYNDGGNSYRGRNRDSMGRYSRDDGKEHMVRKLREMMGDAESETEREALRHCISKIENA